MSIPAKYFTTLSVTLSLLTGCGGAGMFGPTFPDNKQSDVAAVVQRLAARPASTPAPVAVGITHEPARLFAVDLRSGTKSWEINVSAPASAPVIAGDYVLLHEARGVVGYRLQDGHELFVVEDEAMSLTGGGGDGALAAFALSTGGGVGARSTLGIIEGGSVTVYRDLEMTIGAPTASRGLIFVPWSTQNLSVIEPGGAEIARVRVLDSPIARAVVQHGQVYFGQMGVYPFGGETTAETFVQPLPRSLPGAPAFMIDPYAPTPGAASAIHKIRLDWQIASGGADRFQNDTVYATFYRLVFGLPAQEDGVRFVYSHDEDIVGAQVLGNGLLVADEGGGLTLIDAEGQASWQTTLDVQPTAMTFRSTGFSPSANTSGTRISLEDQLLAAAQNTDSRIVPARRLALELLAAAPGATVTAHLLAVCEDRRAPAPIRQQACTTLTSRDSGADAIVAALGRHTAFLSDVQAPPLQPLAQAAAHMNATAALPHLRAHLEDPHTEAADLAALVTAIGALGGEDAVLVLRRWLQLYHASAANAGPLAVALGAGATALLAIQNEEGTEFLAELSADPLAGAAGQVRIDQALLTWQESQDAAAAANGESEEEEEDEEETIEEPEGPPNATTLRIAMDVLRPVGADIQSCLREDPRHAQSARVALVLQGDGTVHSMSVLPERLGACIEPLIRSQDFPGNSRDVREQVTLTFRR